MGSDKRFGRRAQRIGSRDKVGFVICEEFKHGRLHCALADTMAQAFGRQAGKGQQPLGTPVVDQRPAECLKRQDFGCAGFAGFVVG